MPGRIMPLITNNIYHVFNLGIDHRPTFTDRKEYLRAKEAIDFYRFIKFPIKLSTFLNKSEEDKTSISIRFKEKNEKLIEILSFCLMPNHFHFLIKQLKDNGISKFMSNFLNSYTRYFNTKHERKGPLFLDQFKAVILETDNLLLHISRYIHLNPYSSLLVKTIKDLEKYPWSSFSEFVQERNEKICKTSTILSLCGEREKYKKFVFDQAEYQRKLDQIKHLVFE